MISVSLKVFENGQNGLQVTVFARGEAKSKREQIYLEKLQPAIQQALLDAGAEVERQGLGEGLTDQFKQAVNSQAPAPIGDTAVELKFPTAVNLEDPPAGPNAFLPRPPSFPHFIFNLSNEFRAMWPQDMDRTLVVAQIDLMAKRVQEFLDKQLAFVAHAKRQENRQGGN